MTTTSSSNPTLLYNIKYRQPEETSASQDSKLSQKPTKIIRQPQEMSGNFYQQPSLQPMNSQRMQRMPMKVQRMQRGYNLEEQHKVIDIQIMDKGLKQKMFDIESKFNWFKEMRGSQVKPDKEVKEGRLNRKRDQDPDKKIKEERPYQWTEKDKQMAEYFRTFTFKTAIVEIIFLIAFSIPLGCYRAEDAYPEHAITAWAIVNLVYLGLFIIYRFYMIRVSLRKPFEIWRKSHRYICFIVHVLPLWGTIVIAIDFENDFKKKFPGQHRDPINMQGALFIAMLIHRYVYLTIDVLNYLGLFFMALYHWLVNELKSYDYYTVDMWMVNNQAQTWPFITPDRQNEQQ